MGERACQETREGRRPETQAVSFAPRSANINTGKWSKTVKGETRFDWESTRLDSTLSLPELVLANSPPIMKPSLLLHAASFRASTTTTTASTSPAARLAVQLLPPLPLYRRLLRVHRKALPIEMRLMGDEYVKVRFLLSLLQLELTRARTRPSLGGLDRPRTRSISLAS